jgi:acetyl esterase/lipase
MPGWNWAVELGTAIIRNQLVTAFAMPDVTEQRRYLDCLVLNSSATQDVWSKDVLDEEFSGTWYFPKDPSPVTLLYLHGGGFAFYPKSSYANLIALIALAANSSTFAVDYRLTPEHRFPAALDDARAAYLWLVKNGSDPKQIVVAGDSAGGNLTLSLLCDLRDRGLPLPALGVALSPATEFDTIRPSMTTNEHSDWITGQMALTWRDWYCSPDERALPLVSPIHANLRGLPPIYIQAGRAEILYDSIVAFAIEAKSQGANVTLETWESMNHVFQFFGHDAPQSSEALRRIGEVIAQTIR